MKSESDFFDRALLDMAQKLIEVSPDRADDPQVLSRRAADLARALVIERQAFLRDPPEDRKAPNPRRIHKDRGNALF